MIFSNTIIQAQPAPWRMGGVNIHIASVGADNKLHIAKPLEFGEPVDEGAVFGDPALSLAGDQGQMLMDQLWNCGIRPSEGSGSAGSLAATQRHLDDMRTLVAAHLKLAWPEAKRRV